MKLRSLFTLLTIGALVAAGDVVAWEDLPARGAAPGSAAVRAVAPSTEQARADLAVRAAGTSRYAALPEVPTTPVLAQVDGGAPASAPVVSGSAARDRSGGSQTPGAASASSSYWQNPAAHHWAVIIGINDYAGSTEDAIGSRQDAVALRKMLLKRGWRKDHIRMLLDRDATAKRIVKALEWLAARTTSESVVIFHYAGHEMPFYRDRDGDGERRDVALWAADNRFVVDGTLAKLMKRVQARRMWIHFATCRAGGFNDKGMLRDGRVVTYSSPEHEYSYEDPNVGHSVMGYYMLIEGMRKQYGDRNGNGAVSVEEAFRFARKRVEKRTGDRQHPFIEDRFKGHFSLRVPAAKRASERPSQQPPQEQQNCALGICP